MQLVSDTARFGQLGSDTAKVWTRVSLNRAKVWT